MRKLTEPVGSCIPWLRRHSGIITILGPFIVFGTFIFKEVLRERQKDLVDDIKSEEGAVAVQNQIHSLYQLVWENYYKNLENALVSLNTDAKKRPKEPDSEYELRFLEDAWIDLYNACSMNMHNISQSLKLASELSRKLNAFSSDILQLETMVNENSYSLRFYTRFLAPNSLTMEAFMYTDKTGTKVKELHLDQIKIADTIKDLTDNLLEKERDVLEKAEKKYTIFTNVSYGLYTLGFLVTVCGQLLGIKAPSEG